MTVTESQSTEKQNRDNTSKANLVKGSALMTPSKKSKADILTPPRPSSKVKHLLERIDKNAKIMASSDPPQVMVARVISAGMHDGDFARIYINDVDHSFNARGFNIVVVKPTNLEVNDVQSFNTHDNDAASLKMARYIHNLPVGRIVLIAVRTDATAHICERVYSCIATIGRTLISTWFWWFMGILWNKRRGQEYTTFDYSFSGSCHYCSKFY